MKGKVSVKIHNDYVCQDKEKIDKIIERITKIINGSYARQSNTAQQT